MTTTTTTPKIYQEKRRSLHAAIEHLDGLIVALSGGVDSAVLLALAVEALGPDRVVAATGRSESLPSHELDDARAVAAAVGVEHVVLRTHELQRPGYRANAGDRCFHCRLELFGALKQLAADRKFGTVAFGAIVDDVGDFRPGMKAASDLGVIAPLLDSGMGKAEVRRVAAEFRLPVRDKPAAACLASRIPTGREVTPGLLGQVDRAEQALRALGIGQLRVRHHGEIARIELAPADLARLADPDFRASVSRAVRDAGFRFVTVDLEGYRTGSLNPPGSSGQ